MTAALILTAVLLDLAVVWKAYQLLRAPRDLPLRAVTLCVACAAASFSLGLGVEARAVDALVGHGAARLAENSLLLGTAYWLMCFYLFSAAEPAQALRRARREAVPLALAVGVLTVTTVVTPVGIRGRDFATADLQVPSVAMFFVTALVYLVYALAVALWWTWRYARMSRKPLATGLWLTAGALAIMVIANIGRLTVNVIRWSGNDAPAGVSQSAMTLLALAVPLFVVGVSYSGIAMRFAGIRIWWQHRRSYRRLRPLWAALHDAYPQDSLSRIPTSARQEFLSVRGVHFRYYRRVIECRDGLVRISPYLAQLGVENGTPAEALADHLGTALRAQAAGEPAASQAVAVARPVEDSLDADVQQLLYLSEALSSPR